MESTLKEKFRKLNDSQGVVVSTADFLIANSSHSTTIVKAWNQEFINASVDKKLTLLYLANDVLQRCKTGDFLTEFLRYLPKATAHLYKHGDSELKSSLDRLVEVWDKRKVLRTRGMAAVRTQLAKVKLLDSGGLEENKDETSSQGSKRKRDISGPHPITDALEEVQKAVNKTKESDNELKQLLGSRDVGSLTETQLRSLQELNGKQHELVKQEVNLRKKVVDLLRQNLTKQEEGQKKAKEMHRLCIARKGEIESLLGVSAPTQVQSSTQASLQEVPGLSLEPRSYGGQLAPLGCQLSMIPEGADLHFGSSGHPSFVSHSLLQPMPSGSFFPVFGQSQHSEDSQDRQMSNVHGLNRPFLPSEYLQSNQSNQRLSYGSHTIHDVHNGGGSYLHPISFDGFPEQYDPEKEWEV